MKNTVHHFFSIAFIFFLNILFTSLQAQDLNIEPRFQQTPVWCWLTVGQMIFEHYNIPSLNPNSYQCGIVAIFGGPFSPCWSNCGNCVVPSGNFETIVSMLSIYPRGVASFTGLHVPHIRGVLSQLPISIHGIVSEIDNDHPIITGISPSGFPHMVSEHVALIVGYENDNADGDVFLTIKDPFPYDLPEFRSLPNPYTRARGEDNGDESYRIKYSDFINGLLWHETIIIRE